MLQGVQLDKLIISELLCFIQCKKDVMDEVSLNQICATQFSEQEIDTAFGVLFEYLQTKRSTRRGEGKSQRQLCDIVKQIKDTDPGQLPVFVAKDLNRLPPVTFDHVDVSTLLRDILTLKKDIQAIQVQQNLTTVKFDAKITEIQGEISKKSCSKTTDIDLTKPSAGNSNTVEAPLHRNASSVNTKVKSAAKKTETAAAEGVGPKRASLPLTYAHASRTSLPPPPPRHTHILGAAVTNAKSKQPPPPGPKTTSLASTTSPLNKTTSTSAPSVVQSGQLTAVTSSILQSSYNKTPDSHSKVGGSTVRRKKAFSIGKAVLPSDSKLVAAAPTTSGIFVSRFHLSTTENCIREYVEKKGFSIESVSKIISPSNNRSNSYRLTIKQTDEIKLLSEDFWPQGILFRRYF